MFAKKLIYGFKPPCSRCLYRLGVIKTVNNPCPMCRLENYRTFKMFQDQLSKVSITNQSESKAKENADSERTQTDVQVDVTFQQLHESIKGLSAAVSSLIEQEEKDRPMRDELIKMLPDILVTMAEEDDKDNQEENNQ